MRYPIYRIVPDTTCYSGDSVRSYVNVEKKWLFWWTVCGHFISREIAIQQIAHWMHPPEEITHQTIVSTMTQKPILSRRLD